MTSVAESRVPVGDRLCCGRPPARVELILGPGHVADSFHVVVVPAEIARFGAETEGAASLRPSGRMRGPAIHMEHKPTHKAFDFPVDCILRATRRLIRFWRFMENFSFSRRAGGVGPVSPGHNAGRIAPPLRKEESHQVFHDFGAEGDEAMWPEIDRSLSWSASARSRASRVATGAGGCSLAEAIGDDDLDLRDRKEAKELADALSARPLPGPKQAL